MVRCLIILILMGIAIVSRGQTSISPESDAPNSRKPGSSSAAFGSKRTSKKVSTHKYLKKSAEGQIDEYRKRVRNASKQYRKEQKLMTKPKYSNPLYYGHNRPPKIRKVGKRKFCKTCEIVH